LWTAEWDQKTYAEPVLAGLKEKLLEGKRRILDAVQFVKSKPPAYLDLSGRRLVDSAIAVLIGHLLLGQGARDQRKQRVARRFIEREMPALRMHCAQILSGDMAALEEYAMLAGPVPAAE
jgi:hypothetical protein